MQKSIRRTLRAHTIRQDRTSPTAVINGHGVVVQRKKIPDEPSRRATRLPRSAWSTLLGRLCNKYASIMKAVSPSQLDLISPSPGPGLISRSRVAMYCTMKRRVLDETSTQIMRVSLRSSQGSTHRNSEGIRQCKGRCVISLVIGPQKVATGVQTARVARQRTERLLPTSTRAKTKPQTSLQVVLAIHHFCGEAVYLAY